MQSFTARETSTASTWQRSTNASTHSQGSWPISGNVDTAAFTTSWGDKNYLVTPALRHSQPVGTWLQSGNTGSVVFTTSWGDGCYPACRQLAGIYLEVSNLAVTNLAVINLAVINLVVINPAVINPVVINPAAINLAAINLAAINLAAGRDLPGR
jgi:hypothetical protein